MRQRQRKIAKAASSSEPDLDAVDLFVRALKFHRLGEWAAARAGYKQVLEKSPNEFDALRLLGVCEHQCGDTEAGARLLQRALLIDPRSAAVYSHLSAMLIALKRPAEALGHCESALAIAPDSADAHYNRGNALLALRRFPEAVISFDKTIALDPENLDALSNRGNALLEMRQFDEAIENYNGLLALKPSHGLAILNRGAAFKDSGQLEKALADFDLALALSPNHCGAWINRGETLRLLQRGDEALASFDKALSINPELSDAWLGRANVLMLLMSGRVNETLAACQHALAIKPDSVMALIQLGQWHAQQGDAEAAMMYFDRALSIKPDHEVALANRIYTLDFSNDDTAQHQAARVEWWRQIGSSIAAARPLHHYNGRDPHRRIVLGYVSAEFKQRSAAYVFRPVLANHDKTRFKIVCYSASPTNDAVTDTFRNLADGWRDVSQWSDDRLADCIRSDQVDILIDLSGHGGGNRLRVFALKPAPVQVTAWGHATGTGLPTIDYLFSDPVAIPAEVRHLFAEQIYDLPCLMIVEPPLAEIRRPARPVMSNGYVTYGVLNRVSKISDAAISVWARILQSDVTSRLLLKDHLIDDASVRATLLERFARHGIAPARICFQGRTSREAHLAAHQQVDICLDPFPQGGGVTTWEALYMGVPVVAKLGNSVASRLAGAILSAVGLSDWVAANDDEYVEIALRSTRERLEEIRSELPSLIERRCRPAEYTRAVEEAYRTMWRKYCAERL
jgi:predicted O-linked N-acetylglucosamine transferase (SPINDLY family)